MLTTVRFIDRDTGEVVWEDDFDPESCCEGWHTGETGCYCGGCIGCMSMQAEHSGLKVEHVERGAA